MLHVFWNYLAAMKALISTMILLCMLQTGRTQDSIAGRRIGSPMPAFMLRLPNETYFYQKDLNPKKHTVLMIFSPDCDHCIQQTRALTDSIRLFNNTQFILSTTLPMERLKDFYQSFNLSQHRKQLVAGRDVLFFFSKYFENHFLPFIAIYDPRQQLKVVFEGNVTMKTLLTHTN